MRITEMITKDRSFIKLLKEMYHDHAKEFVCGYLGFEG